MRSVRTLRCRDACVYFLYLSSCHKHLQIWFTICSSSAISNIIRITQDLRTTYLCLVSDANMKIDPCKQPLSSHPNDSVNHSLPRKLDTRYAEYENEWQLWRSKERRFWYEVGRHRRHEFAPSKAITFPHIRCAVLCHRNLYQPSYGNVACNRIPNSRFNSFWWGARSKMAPNRVCVMQVSDRSLSQWRW